MSVAFVSVAPGCCGVVDELEVPGAPAPVDEPVLGDVEPEAPVLLEASAPVFGEAEAPLVVSLFASAFESAFGEADGLALAPAEAPAFASTPSLLIVSASSRPLAFRPSLL